MRWQYHRWGMLAYSKDLPLVTMNRRRATIIVGLVDAVVWAAIAYAAFMSGSDAATRGLDRSAGLVVTALFLVTAAPALALAWVGRSPTLALSLALAFPVAFAALFIVVWVALP